MGTTSPPLHLPELRDGDVLLRRHTAADLDGLLATARDEQTQRWTVVPVPYGRADAEAYLAHLEDGLRQGTASFAVEHAGRYAGTVRLRPDGDGWAEVGFGTTPQVRGRGLTTRAVRLLLRWGLQELDLDGVRWRAQVGNRASRRVAWRCGFRVEGTVRGLCLQRGQRHDGWVGSLRRGEPLEPATPWLEVPELHGDGVRLRALHARDAARVAQACTDPTTQHWLPSLPSPYTVAHAEEFIASRTEVEASGEELTWCVVDDADRCLAAVSLFLTGRGPGAGELGWWAHPAARGRGAVTRAARLAARHAFAPAEEGGLELHRLLVRVAAPNSASRAVAVRLGAHAAGVDRDAELLRDGRREDMVRYDLLHHELT